MATISSYYQVVELLKNKCDLHEMQMEELRKLLQWRLPISLKPAKNEALGIGEIQMLYTIEDIFQKLPS